MRSLNRLRPWEFQKDGDARANQTVAALRSLASDFATLRGPKSLVWISRGIPAAITGRDGLLRDYTPVVSRLGTDLARSGIAVYAVDQADRRTDDLTGQDTPQQIAGLTGGQWLPVNATARAIEQAISDGAATFQIGYIPPADRWDDKFHHLRVTSANKGVRLRSIDGYFGDAREADPQQRLDRK